MLLEFLLVLRIQQQQTEPVALSVYDVTKLY